MEMPIRYRYKLIRTQIKNRSSHWSTQLLFSEEESLSQALKGGAWKNYQRYTQTPRASLIKPLLALWVPTEIQILQKLSTETRNHLYRASSQLCLCSVYSVNILLE